MTTMQDAITALQTAVLTVSGIREAPTYPEDQLGVYPYSVAYAQKGTWDYGPAGDKKGLHTLVVEIHFSRDDLRSAIMSAMGFSDSIPNAIMTDPTLGGKVSTIGRISYEFGPMAWGGIDTIGWRFTIEDVKMVSVLT